MPLLARCCRLPSGSRDQARRTLTPTHLFAVAECASSCRTACLKSDYSRYSS